MSGTPRAAVIGAGFGGLAAAIRLQAAGVQTTIFEKRDRPGGRAYVFEDSGFTFDAGPTVITAPNVLEELFALGGRSLADAVRLIPIDPMYRLQWSDGQRLDYSADTERMMAQIATMNPADVDGYRRFLRFADEVFQEGYVKLADQAFQSFWTMARVAPQLVRLQGYRSVHSVIAKHIRDPHLRQAFSFHTLLVGGNPFSVSAIYALIAALERKWGVHYAMGGTGALVAALADLFRDLGGELRLNAAVDRITTRDGRVTGIREQDGNETDVTTVVSNADIGHSYAQLLADEKRAQSMRGKLERQRWSMSLFLVYFGLRGEYPDIAHHTVLFAPRYRELLAEIFGGDRLPDDFSLYLHAPSTHDPGVAPAGCSAFYALAPVPHLGHAAIDWETEAPAFRDRILTHLESEVLPGLKKNLLTCRVFTPRDFETQLNARHGSAFSLEPVLTQSAWFRPHNRDDNIGGLYFTGAGTHPGAGIPGVVNSAKATARLILNDLGKVTA